MKVEENIFSSSYPLGPNANLWLFFFLLAWLTDTLPRLAVTSPRFDRVIFPVAGQSLAPRGIVLGLAKLAGPSQMDIMHAPGARRRRQGGSWAMLPPH